MAEEIVIGKQKKGDKEEEEVQSLSPAWSQLLPELLSRISLHVFRGGDVGVLSLIPSVCKSWNLFFDVNHTTNLIRKSLRDPPLNALSPDYPCLVSLKGSSCTFYHPNRNFTVDFPELSGFYIRYSKFGWLLMCKDNGHYYTYFFFNPFTRQKIDLPTSEDTFCSICFSSPPTSPDCFVIGMAYHEFGITRRGEQKWVLYGSLTDLYIPYSHPVLCGEHCYAVGDGNRILAIDLKKKSISFLGKGSSLDANVSFLVGDGPELLAVMVPNEQKNIYIKKMDPSKRKWLRVKSLENKKLFVCKTSSILKPAPVKVASNKIYFPKILNDESFVPYCLATRKYISFLGNYAKSSPWSENENVTEWFNSTWIETMPFVPTAASNQQIEW